VFTSDAAHPRDQLRVVEEMAQPERRPLRRADDVAGDAVRDLGRQATDGAADHGLALPHRLGHPDGEPVADGFLQHDRGRSLERVDLELGVGRKLECHDIGIAGGRLPELREHLPAFGPVAAAPRQHEPHVVVLLHDPVGVDHADGIAGAVDGTDLEEHGLVERYPDPLQDRPDLPPREFPVLVRERVDGRVHDELRYRKMRHEAGA